MRIPVTITFSDLRQLEGVRQPMRVQIENPQSGRTVLTFADVESGLELGDEVFTLREPDAK